MSVTTPRLPEPSYLDYPFAIDPAGRAAQTLGDDHVRDMIEQVLFTAPGERVMLPDFGCGLLGLVFEPNSGFVAAATQLLVRGSLQRWLDDVIDARSVQINNIDSTLVVDIQYVRLADGTQTSVQIVAPSAGP